MADRGQFTTPTVVPLTLTTVAVGVVIAAEVAPVLPASVPRSLAGVIPIALLTVVAWWALGGPKRPEGDG